MRLPSVQDHAQLASMILAGSLAVPVSWWGLLPVWRCRLGERVVDGLVGASGEGWRVALAPRLPASGGACRCRACLGGGFWRGFWSCRLGQDHAQLSSMILAGSLVVPVGWPGLLPVWVCR
jgi:hypothetical protein